MPEHLAAAHSATEALLCGGAAIARRRIHLRCIDGTIVPARACAALVFNGDHSPSHLVVHYEDTTTTDNQP